MFEKLQYSFSKYPDVYGDNQIQIIHISRDTMVDKYPNFHHYLLTWNRKYGWSKEEKVFPIKSGILNVLGSGKEEFKKNYNELSIDEKQNVNEKARLMLLDQIRRGVNN